MPLLESVGQFFGISSQESISTIEEWREKVHTKIKQGDFGISLRRSVSAFQRVDSAHLLTRARKVLSLVEAAQKVDDPSDDEEGRNTDVVDDAKSQSRPEAKSGLEVIVNQLYCHEEDEQIDSESAKDLQTSKPSLLDSDEGLCMSKANNISTDEKILSRRSSTDIDKQTEVNEKKDGVLFRDDNYKDSKVNIHYPKANSEVTDKKVKSDRTSQKSGHFIQATSQSSLKKEKCSLVKYEVSLKGKENELDTEIEFRNIQTSKNEIRLKQFERTSSTSVENDGEDTIHEIEEKSRRSFGPEDFVFGKDAYVHYMFFTQVEKKQEKKYLEKKLREKTAQYDWKIAAVDELVSMAKDYYWNPKSLKADKWKALKQRVKKNSSHKLTGAVNRKKLDSVRQFKPLFTIIITIVQLIAFTAMCGFGGLTYIGLEPTLTLENDVQTFFGMETVHKWVPPNIWLGPDQHYIISLGGLFAPCMRSDIGIQLLYTNQNFSQHNVLGCCEIQSRNTAATTTETECSHMTEGVGLWRAGVSCGKRPPELSSIRHVLKPCCVGNKVQCQLLSYKHCMFLRGNFYKTGPEHCSQVNCLGNYCTPGSLSAHADQPWYPASPKQWWRVPLSLVYHQGIIEVVLVAGAQLLLMVQMERTSGWLRMIIIYTLSGSGALLVASIVEPYQCHVGGVGALFGMLGVTLIELLHFWTIVTSPVLELVKLLAVICFFLLLGTLPYLSIFGMFSGLIIGAVTGILVIPYVTFSALRTRVRLVLVCIAFPILLLSFFIILHVFISVQSTENCQVCKIINCVAYTEKMCNASLWNQ